jgi:hypothetical protein
MNLHFEHGVFPHLHMFKIAGSFAATGFSDQLPATYRTGRDA